MNREQRRSLARQQRPAAAVARRPLGCHERRTDELRQGDLVVGTAAGDTYPAPRRLAAREPAPEHSVRTDAYWLTWQNGQRQVYYGDTVVYVRTPG